MTIRSAQPRVCFIIGRVSCRLVLEGRSNRLDYIVLLASFACLEQSNIAGPFLFKKD